LIILDPFSEGDRAAEEQHAATRWWLPGGWRNAQAAPVYGAKKLTESNQIYPMRIGKDYRLSFQLENQTCILRRVGPRQMFYDSY